MIMAASDKNLFASSRQSADAPPGPSNPTQMPGKASGMQVYSEGVGPIGKEDGIGEGTGALSCDVMSMTS